MASKEDPPKLKGGACQNCKRRKIKCVAADSDSTMCAYCQKAQVQCKSTRGSKFSSTDVVGQLTKEEPDCSSECEPTRSYPAPSSATVSYSPQDTQLNLEQDNLHSDKKGAIQTLRSGLPPNRKRSRPQSTCGICHKEHCFSDLEKVLDPEIVRCLTKDCGAWYHLSCVLFTQPPRPVFYSPSTYDNNPIFFCNDCDHRREYHQARDALMRATEKIDHETIGAHLRAREEFTKATEKIEKDARSKYQKAQKDFGNFMHSKKVAKHDVRSQGVINVQAFDLDSVSELVATSKVPGIAIEPRPAAAFFELAQEEKYQGFEENIIRDLLHSIQTSTFNYRCEIEAVRGMLRDGRNYHNDINQPLKFWNRIDPAESSRIGQEWFHTKNAQGRPFQMQACSEGHAPITAALRRMLKIPEGKALHISSDLKELSFSYVYTAFVNWFVIDVVNNELDFMSIPNMQPLHSMMLAVTHFGNARFQSFGNHVLREVLLRTWHQQRFQTYVMENVDWQGELVHRLEDFIKPLIKDSTGIGRLNPWIPSRLEIIKHTIVLWSYLWCAGMEAREEIHPIPGDLFDHSLHEIPITAGYVEEDSRHRTRTILWVIRRGFRYSEARGDGSHRAIVVKALVLVK